MGYSGAAGKLIREKNQKQKISWHCPFKAYAGCIAFCVEEGLGRVRAAKRTSRSPRIGETSDTGL
jgi:hypothetical protein